MQTTAKGKASTIIIYSAGNVMSSLFFSFKMSHFMVLIISQTYYAMYKNIVTK